MFYLKKLFSNCSKYIPFSSINRFRNAYLTLLYMSAFNSRHLFSCLYCKSSRDSGRITDIFLNISMGDKLSNLRDHSTICLLLLESQRSFVQKIFRIHSKVWRCFILLKYKQMFGNRYRDFLQLL